MLECPAFQGLVFTSDICIVECQIFVDFALFNVRYFGSCAGNFFFSFIEYLWVVGLHLKCISKFVLKILPIRFVFFVLYI